MNKYAGVLLVTQKGQIALQKRDDKPDIPNPGKVSLFGGSLEGTETTVECALRELEEEVSLKLAPKDLKKLGVYYSTVLGVRYESHIFLAVNINSKALKLQEGESICYLSNEDDLDTLNLSAVCRKVLTGYFLKKKEFTYQAVARFR